eukprot:5837628-Amphidinium_carterae.1
MGEAVKPAEEGCYPFSVVRRLPSVIVGNDKSQRDLVAVASPEVEVIAAAVECNAAPKLTVAAGERMVAPWMMLLGAVAASASEATLQEAAAGMSTLSVVAVGRLLFFATTTNCASRSLRLRLRAVIPLPNKMLGGGSTLRPPLD